jgi:PAS domain S-box-containing protein
MLKPGFLNGGGEMADRIRAYDWSLTSLGPMDQWPGNLRITLGILLHSSFPMFLFWGEDLICFYNDAFRHSLGVDGKHPMLGEKGSDAWADTWHTTGKLLDNVRMTGKAARFEDMPAFFAHNGRAEESYWTFSLSPIFGEQGGIDGIFVTCVETTEKVITLQRLAESETRFRTMAESPDITEQIQFLDQVRDSELDLRNIVRKAPIGICILDARTLVAETVNNSFVQVAGKPHDAIAGKYYWDAFPEARPFYEDALTGVARDGKTFYADEVELMLIRHGVPELVYVTFVYAPVFDLAGHVKKVAIWVQENTTQVASRRRLQEAEKKATLAIDSADLGVYEIDYATDTMLTDQRFKTIWGVDDLNLTRSDYVRSIHPDDLHDRETAHQRSLNTGQLDYRARILWPDGAIRWVRITGTVIYDEHAKAIKLIGIAQDITDAVLAQKKIEDSEKSIRTMILQAPVAMCIFRGPSYRVTIANPKMIELWGKQLHEVIDKPIFEGLPETKDQGLEALLHHVYTTDETFTAHERPVLLPRNGKTETVYVDFVYESLTPGDDDAKDILVVAIDVTYQVIARRKIEEVVAERTKELAEANEQLQQSNAELSQFAYIASHDLQEPIRKIATYAGLLEDQPETTHTAKNYLDKIISGSERMQTLIRGVLSYSELSRTTSVFEPVDLNHVLNDILAEFDLLIEQKQAQIRRQPLPTIDAVPLQMIQLFSNLISNALKYARAGVPPVITVVCRLEDAQYHIDVTDNGIGFAQEHAEQIFSIFKRLHRKTEYSGTGIGLAMCKKIVENHHGHIFARSQPGEGATFHLVLPARG